MKKDHSQHFTVGSKNKLLVKIFKNGSQHCTCLKIGKLTIEFSETLVASIFVEVKQKFLIYMQEIVSGNIRYRQY